MTPRLLLTIGILGGTGPEGQGLAYRWGKAGYHVVIGSRSAEKAEAVAADLNQRLETDQVRGLPNEAAAAQCDIAVLTVPYEAHRSLLTSLRGPLQGKLLVDVTVPLVPPEVTTVRMPPAGSAAAEAQEILGDGARVAAAFHNVSHVHLSAEEGVPCDVLVCGVDREARDQAIKLAEAAGMVAWDAGPLENAVVVEGLTSVLLGINKRYRIRSAGIRITGERKPQPA
jgi:NADPH-dependent F420 reductase